MLLIAHRGNVNGKNEILENTPDYIITAINKGYDCEIDIWYIDYTFYLGHDLPNIKINFEFLNKYKDNLWIHCKNIDALCFMNTFTDFNYFFHDKDQFTLTSKNYIWGNINSKVGKNIICVMPEHFHVLNIKDLSNCIGICSDNIEYYEYVSSILN